MTQPTPKVFPPTYFAYALAAMTALHLLLPIVHWLGSPWRFVGLLLMLAGAALAVSGRRLFAKRGTPIRPFEESTTLVIEGPYRYSRNPMYTGLALMLAGLAFLLGSLSPVIIPPIFVWWITTRFIRKEEALLERRFGVQYLDYKRRVRRWL